jgi:hypothetical protein
LVTGSFTGNCGAVRDIIESENSLPILSHR